METPQDVLQQIATPDAAASFIAWRNAKKAPLTVRAAAMVVRTLRQIEAAGGDPDEALDIAQERGWLTIKPEWYWRDKNANSNETAQLSHGPENRADPALDNILRLTGHRRSSGDGRL
jgi:hypothetical protein